MSNIFSDLFRFIWAVKLFERSRRKRGWRFTAGLEFSETKSGFNIPQKFDIAFSIRSRTLKLLYVWDLAFAIFKLIFIRNYVWKLWAGFVLGITLTGTIVFSFCFF